MNEIKKLEIKNAIRLVIGGWILDGNDVIDVPVMLTELVVDYTDEIEKNL